MNEKFFIQKGSFYYVVVDDYESNPDWANRPIEVYPKSFLESKDAQIKLLKEALESIAKMDISEDAPDVIWLNKWRNDTKELASRTLKKLEEMERGNERP